jgi:hypothetical protein
MSPTVAIVLVTGIALGLLMRATISMRWGSPVPLGLPLLIAVADVGSPIHVVLVFIVATFVIFITPSQEKLKTVMWFVARCALATAISALWWAFGDQTATPHLTLLQSIHALNIAAAVFIVDLMQEKIRFHGIDWSVVRKLGATYVSVFLSELLLALAIRAHDFNLAVLPAIIAAVLWYGSKTLAKNQKTVAEATATMGTFPELTKFSPVGHSQRMVLLVRAIGKQAGFGPTHLEFLARGAAVARIGYIAFPDVDAIQEGYEIPTREEVAIHADHILSNAKFLSDTAGLVDGFLREKSESLTLDEAVLRIAANFDDLTAGITGDDHEIIKFGLARIRELANSRNETKAIRYLEDAFESTPHLLDDLRQAGQMREDIRAEIETRMAGR